MIRSFILFTWLLGSITFGQVPDVEITDLMASNHYATVAGRLKSKPQGPVGISVRNGNIMYSTITDTEGRWGIVIRHLSVNVTVTSWDLNTAQKGNEIQVSLK